jgi:ABC-type branched-subunit amino acid transport system substrate-binding protein
MKRLFLRTLLILAVACFILSGYPVAVRASMNNDIGSASRNIVGLVLPLSGKWESVSQRILKAIEMAGGVFTPGPTPNVEYIIRDYGNNEDSIPSIIKDLDENYKVTAIIGPVGVGERISEIACKELQTRHIPAFIFPQAELPPKDGTYCFRNFITIDIQVKSLLTAARSMGITRFAVMSPNDRFGKTFSEKFQRLAPAYGVNVVRTTVYSPQNVDFKQQVGSLFSGTRKKTSPTVKSIDFDALLIPDTSANAAMVASYISLMKIKNIRLFGPILWDTPDFLKAGGRYVENAVYLSGYYQGSILSAVQEFNHTFSHIFKYPPSVWEASAYDSASILQKFFQSKRPSREALKEYLGTLKNYPGVSGITSFSSNGTLDKSIYLLTIKDGAIYEIHP